jgi:hypothetical protein
MMICAVVDAFDHDLYAKKLLLIKFSILILYENSLGLAQGFVVTFHRVCHLEQTY